MEKSFIDNSVSILTNENVNNEEIENILNELINIFNKNRIYISLFIKHINEKKLNFYLILVELFIKKLIKDEKSQDILFQLINILMNNYECKLETYNYIFQILSKIYFNNSLFDEIIILNFLKLLEHLYQYEKEIKEPNNYFFFQKNCVFEYQFNENNTIDLKEFGLYITLHIKLLEPESENIVKLFSISSSKDNKYSYSLILNSQYINLYNEEKKKIIKTINNEENIKFPFNTQLILSFIINHREIKFMLQGNEKEYIFDTKDKNEIDNLTFFENCSGECYSIVLASVLPNIVLENYFTEIIKYTQICVDPKYLNNILQFYKIQNIICYFTPSVNILKDNSFEDVVYSQKIKMKGDNCGIHKFFNNCKYVSCIGGIKNILPLIEIINYNLNKISLDNIKISINIILNILKNLCGDNNFNIKDFRDSHFIEILSLFLENLPNSIFTLDLMKQLNEILKIFVSKKIENNFLNDILLNEKLYFKFNLESQHFIMDELINNYQTIIPIGKICVLLKYYDEKINDEFCCEEHSKSFINVQNVSDKNLEFLYPKVTSKIFTFIQLIIIRKDIFSLDNFSFLFKLLSLKISPCLVKNIIDIFIDYFNRNSENLEKRTVAKHLFINCKFWDIIIKLLKTTLYDVKVNILKLILLIPKGDRNENLSSYLPQILMENLFEPSQFLDENNQSILKKEYIENNFNNLYYKLLSLFIGKGIESDNDLNQNDKINNPLLIEPLVHSISTFDNNEYYLKCSQHLLILFENNYINCSLIFNNKKFIEFLLNICYKFYKNEEGKDLFENYHKILMCILCNSVKNLKNKTLPSNILNLALVWSKKVEKKDRVKEFITYLFESFYNFLENESKGTSIYKVNAYLNLVTLFSIYLEFVTIYNLDDTESIEDYSCYLKGIVEIENNEFEFLMKIYNYIKQEFNLSFLDELCGNENVQTLIQKHTNVINTIIFNITYKNFKINELRNLSFVQIPNIQLNRIILIFIYLLINISETVEEKIKWIEELQNFVYFYIIFSCNIYYEPKEENLYKNVQDSTINILYFSFSFLNELYNTENINEEIKNKIEDFNSVILSLILMIRIKYVQTKEVTDQTGFLGKLFKKGTREDLENGAINIFVSKYTNLDNLKLEKYENDNFKVFGNILNNDEEPFKIMILMNQTLKLMLNKFFQINVIKNKINNVKNVSKVNFGEIQAKKDNNLNEITFKRLKELVLIYQGLLSNYSNTSSLIIKRKKNYYRKIKKEIFSWKGMWSCSEDLYNNKYKFKILNHYSKYFGRPLIYPILDINYYEPKFKQYNINELFREKLECHNIDLDIENIFKIEGNEEINSDEKKTNYINFIYDKNIKELNEQYLNFSINNTDFLKEEISFINYYDSLRVLSPNESPLKKNENIYKVSLIKEQYHIKGFLFVDKNDILFKYYDYNIENNSLIFNKSTNLCYGETFKNEKNNNNLISIKIPYEDIKIILRKRYMQREIGLEIINKKQKERYFTFITKDDRDKCLNDIQIHFECLEIKLDTNMNIDEYKNTIGYISGKKSLFTREKTLSDLIKLWSSFKISNFEFLMWLNLYSNRSYSDLSQYPIFPWIISKFDKENLIIEKDIRDFSLPMGMMTFDEKGKERKKNYISFFNDLKEKYNKMNDEENKENKKNDLEIPYYYETQMSNKLYVSQYLKRIFPFTNIAFEIEDNNVDEEERCFISIEKSFQMASSNKNDIREIIPEFFILPEMFVNINDINLGELRNGDIINDVNMPKWGLDPYKFIYEQRKILESNIVSNKIAEWINLIFGYQSRGKFAVKKCNVFNPYSYEIDIEKVNDENREHILKLCDIGLMPKQLCTNEINVKKKVNEFKLVFDQESIITRYESCLIENNDNKKRLYSFKICQEENRIIIIDNYNVINVFKINFDSIEYKPTHKILIFDNNENQIKRVVFRFNSFKSIASGFLKGEQNVNNNFNRDFNFIGKMKNKENTNYPIIYFRNPNKYNFITIIQGGFYFPKLLISTVDVYNYNSNYKEDNDFVRAYDSLYFANLPFPITALCLLIDEKELKKISEKEKNNDYEIELLCGNTKGNLFIIKLPDITIKKKAEIKKIFCNNNDEITSVYYSSELSIFASASKDGYLNLYTFPKYKLFRSIYINPEEFSCDEIFIIHSPLPSIIIHSKKNNNLISYSINGTFLNKIEENGIKSPKIAKDSNFNQYLCYIYVPCNSIRTLSLPYFDLKRDIPMSLNNIQYIDISYDSKYCFIGNENASQIIYLKNKI